MTSEAKHSESGKISVGLYWAAAQQRGQAVLLQQEWNGMRCLGRDVITKPQQLADRLRSLLKPGTGGTVPVSVTMGLNSSQVGFYVFDVPSVAQPQLTTLIHTQAEGHLPLSIADMRLAWRVDPGQPSDRCVLAAVRNEIYQQTQSSAIGAEIDSVTPDVVGLIACWHGCFQSSRQRAVLLAIGAEEAVVVLTEYGRILNAARVDVDPAGPAGLLVGDLLQVLVSLDSNMQDTDIFILQDDVQKHPELSDALQKEGFHIHLSELDMEKLKKLGNPDPDVITDCPEAFGLALLGLSGQTVDFDFTKQKSEPMLTRRQEMLSVPVLRTVLWMLLAVVVVTVGIYWKDKAELRMLEKQLSEAQEGQTAQQLLRQMDYRQQIAQARPDLLDLLDILRQTMPEGVLLDQFIFERGRPVELRSNAAGYEQAYEFQKKLQEQKDIRKVQLIEPTLDEKNGKVTFKIRFEYKNFSR